MDMFAYQVGFEADRLISKIHSGIQRARENFSTKWLDATINGLATYVLCKGAMATVSAALGCPFTAFVLVLGLQSRGKVQERARDAAFAALGLHVFLATAATVTTMHPAVITGIAVFALTLIYRGRSPITACAIAIMNRTGNLVSRTCVFLRSSLRHGSTNCARSAYRTSELAGRFILSLKDRGNRYVLIPLAQAGRAIYLFVWPKQERIPPRRAETEQTQASKGILLIG